MKFGSKKGMDSLYIRLYQFRNIYKILCIPVMMSREEYKKQLLILDELLDKLDKHDKSVFNKNFDYEDEDIENYLDDDVFTVPRSKKNKGKIDKLIELNGDDDE